MKPRLSVILALLAVGLAARLIPYVLAQFGMALEPGKSDAWNPMMSGIVHSSS